MRYILHMDSFLIWPVFLPLWLFSRPELCADGKSGRAGQWPPQPLQLHPPVQTHSCQGTGQPRTQSMLTSQLSPPIRSWNISLTTCNFKSRSNHDEEYLNRIILKECAYNTIIFCILYVSYNISVITDGSQINHIMWVFNGI